MIYCPVERIYVPEAHLKIWVINGAVSSLIVVILDCWRSERLLGWQRLARLAVLHPTNDGLLSELFSGTCVLLAVPWCQTWSWVCKG